MMMKNLMMRMNLTYSYKKSSLRKMIDLMKRNLMLSYSLMMIKKTKTLNLKMKNSMSYYLMILMMMNLKI